MTFLYKIAILSTRTVMCCLVEAVNLTRKEKSKVNTAKTKQRVRVLNNVLLIAKINRKL